MRDSAADVKGLGRVVRGQVSASGGIVSGSGFAAVRVSLGAYTITFLTPLKAPPIVVVTSADNGGGAFFFWRVQSVTASSFQVFPSTTTGGASGDAPFYFRAEEAIPA